MADLGKVLQPLIAATQAPSTPAKPKANGAAKPKASPQKASPQKASQPKTKRRAIDVGAVITRALTAAGLMK